jgi:uncharacterized protein YajQ (UPF0234 family)
MPSFDIVCDVDVQEIDNAVNQVSRELTTRFDFKGGISNITFDRNEKVIKIVADDDMKLRSIHQILQTKLAKREIDLRSLSYGKEEPGSGKQLKQTIKLRSGLEKEDGKKIMQFIKGLDTKVQAQMQDDQVRVTGKQIDDLQKVIESLRTSGLGLPLQYINMRR